MKKLSRSVKPTIQTKKYFKTIPRKSAFWTVSILRSINRKVLYSPIVSFKSTFCLVMIEKVLGVFNIPIQSIIKGKTVVIK